ncbi:hypothetical protein [Comamonas sp. C24C]
MTDRELLELAARAAGLRVKFEEVHGCYWIELGQGIPIDVWTPSITMATRCGWQ